MEVILYTTHCPRCEVLKKKLEAKHVKYKECTSIEEMTELGIKSVPLLSIDGARPMDFTASIQWINALEE